jgi:hypothetical protein
MHTLYHRALAAMPADAPLAQGRYDVCDPHSGFLAMNTRHLWRTVGVLLLLIGGALLAFGPDDVGTPLGTVCGLAGLALAMWAWIAPVPDKQDQLKHKTYAHRVKHKK